MASNNLLVFEVAGRQYAFRAAQAQEVIRAVAIAPLPQASGAVLGFINVRGTVALVFSLRSCLHLPAKTEVDLADQIIIANARRQTIGLAVDSVVGVWEHPAERSMRVQEIAPGAEYRGEIACRDGEILFIHDLDQLLPWDKDWQIAASRSV